MRETNLVISGGFYSERYAVEHGIYSMARTHVYGEHPAVWIPEMIEVKLDANANILFRPAHSKINLSLSSVFHLSKGDFVSENYGEFGGRLLTPRETIVGNFVDVFECGDIVYAIDSLEHLSMRHVNIYSFSDNMTPRKIYSSDYRLAGRIPTEMFSFKARFISEEKCYVLVCGIIENNLSTKEETQEISYLLEICAGEISQVRKILLNLDYVNNMVVDNSRLILEADKAVIVIDLITMNAKAYTGISVEAEKDILCTRGKIQFNV